MVKISLDKLEAIIDKTDKPKEDKEKFKRRARSIYDGKTAVYCVSVKKKVPLHDDITAYAIPMGKKKRHALGISGYNNSCKSKATGKLTQIYAMVTNVPSNLVSAGERGSPRRKSKSPKRGKSKSPKRGKSKSPRRKSKSSKR
jgi:hypothetical protein